VVIDGLGKLQLKRLDISNNKIVRPEDYNALIAYLQQNNSLEQLNLSSTQIPSNVAEAILSNISSDLNLVMDLSNNNLGPFGAKVLSKIAYKINNITTLDLSDTDIADEGISHLAFGLRNNYSITRLLLNRNFKGGKGRHAAIDNLIKLISSDCAIRGLLCLSHLEVILSYAELSSTASGGKAFSPFKI